MSDDRPNEGDGPRPDDDMLQAVRDAMEQLSGGPSDLPHEEQHASEVGDQISEQLDAQDARREAPEEESGQHRDERGRFARRDDTPAQDEQPIEQPVEQQPSVDQPPTSWSREARAEWQKLSPALREAVAKREREFESGIEGYRERARQHEAVEQLLAPRRQFLAQYGFKSDAEAIGRLVEISDMLARDPAGTLRNLATYFKVNLGQNTGPSQQQIEQHIQEQVGLRIAQHTVADFERSPPEFYGYVKPIMRQLLAAGQAADMDDAYGKAVQMHPGVQQQLQERARQRHAVKAARASSASLNGAPHGVSATRPSNGRGKGTFGEVADDVRAAIESLS